MKLGKKDMDPHEITKEKHFSLKYNHFYILFFTFDFYF